MDIQTTFESAGWVYFAPRMDSQRPGASKCNGPSAQVSTILIIARSIDLLIILPDNKEATWWPLTRPGRVLAA